MSNYGFIKVAAASPKLKVANPDYNVSEMLKLIKEAGKKGTSVIGFPELSITGYTCADLFLHANLLKSSLKALAQLLEDTKDLSMVIIVGVPLEINDRLYNCAVVLNRGQILGIVPKMFIPNYKEYYEKRWFSSGIQISKECNEVEFLGQKVPFGNLLFIAKEPEFTLGVEVCEDLWAPIPPSSYQVLNGANLIVNLSASNELVKKSDYRRELVVQQSGRGICGYLYASAGVHESTTDLVFSGMCLICENGNIQASSNRFSRESEIIYADLDLESLTYERKLNKSFADNIEYISGDKQFNKVNLVFKDIPCLNKENIKRQIEKNPFVPKDISTVQERCEEIFQIQVAGLAKRLEHTGLTKAVIGVSGGLDSTLALLVTKQTFELLKLPSENIIAVTMPGFGTTDETYANALSLMKNLQVSVKEINIKEACLKHFQDIGHDPDLYDHTYENVQARERTQVLMDLANKINGLVIGTGDLSELALGWCTYNGDHMSMYGVNNSIPKTLVKFLVKWVADNVMKEEAQKTIYRILKTPISPELLPPDEEGRIEQKTEELIGPYELHDFFLFYTLRYGIEPQKVLFLAEIAYQNQYTRAEIKKWLKLFYHRFFQNQFKRSCMPDGPKVGSVSLSPRGDWRMPSDADANIWLKELN